MSTSEEAWADGCLTQNRAACNPNMMKMVLDVILVECEEHRWAHNWIKNTNNRATPR